MKIKIIPGIIPETVSEHVADADFGSRQTNQQLEVEIDREFPNISVVNSEFIEDVAENVRVRIDNRIAEKAFLISQRNDFGPGSAELDWADRMQAEINKQGNLRTHYSDRRNRGPDDRRHEANED